MFGNIYAFMYSMQFFLLFQVKTASEICMSFEAISMPIRPTFSIPWLNGCTRTDFVQMTSFSSQGLDRKKTWRSEEKHFSCFFFFKLRRSVLRKKIWCHMLPPQSSISRLLANKLELRRAPRRVARWFIFKPKSKFWVNFGWSWNGKCWYTLWPFGLCYGRLVNFMVILIYFGYVWYIFYRFGMLYKKIWQHCTPVCSDFSG
jgi:hypothetical protein